MAFIEQSSLNALLDLVGGDVESLNELIESFVDEAPVFSQNLSKGLFANPRRHSVGNAAAG